MPRPVTLPFLLAIVLVAIAGLARPASSGAMASHAGWPPMDGLMMNKTDSTRPLDARPGMDPFGGQDGRYSCDSIHKASQSCLPRFLPGGGGFLMTSAPGHHRLLGGHGDDLVHAGPWGDVIWGDYKPCCQPTSQRDRLFGGPGPDLIYASHGRNTIAAGEGTDVIHGHFGHGKVNCGAGRDVVYIDGRHPRRWKLRNCEVVSRRTGQSAPRWVIRGYPWTCKRGERYVDGRCQA